MSSAHEQRRSLYGLCGAGALLATTLAGCGGGGPAPAPPTTTTTTTTTTTLYPLYTCGTDLSLPAVTKQESKGFCLDDTTFKSCSEEMPGYWPHTSSRVKSLRLFKAWNDEWGGEDVKMKAWANLKNFVEVNDAQVFIGTSVTCNEAQDNADWEVTWALMQYLGPKRVMAVGFGNEMDIMWMWPGVTQQCLDTLWGGAQGGGRYWTMLQQRQEQMDTAGFDQAKITIVWALSVLGGMPFKNDGQARVLPLLKEAWKKWGKRFVWTFNVYAIWDTNLQPDPGHPTQCNNAIKAATTTYTPNMIGSIRERIEMVTGNTDDPFWVGETGWSSPRPDGSDLLQKQCPDFCSEKTFQTIYEKFLSWDLTMAEADAKYQKYAGPENMFYFAMRDSYNEGMGEYFGLVKKCGDLACKLQPNGNPPFSPAANMVAV